MPFMEDFEVGARVKIIGTGVCGTIAEIRIGGVLSVRWDKGFDATISMSLCERISG